MVLQEKKSPRKTQQRMGSRPWPAAPPQPWQLQHPDGNQKAGE